MPAATKLAIAALLLVLVSCDKDNEENDVPWGTGKIAFYELETTSFRARACKVTPADTKLKRTPIVSNKEIVNYDSASRSWQVCDAAWKRLEALQDHIGLAITLNEKAVYYFINKPNYSSSSCDESITMQLWPKVAGFTTENRAHMSLGYAGSSVNIDDLRNAAVLIRELKAQRKLQ